MASNLATPKAIDDAITLELAATPKQFVYARTGNYQGIRLSRAA